MTTKTVHAFRRTKPHTVDIFGMLLKFAANAAGEQVCEVPDGPPLKRLLEIPEAYRLHGAPAVAVSDEDEDNPDAASPYLITVDGPDGAEMTVDLRTFDEAKLRAFAVENDIEVHPNTKRLDTIMNTIVKGLNGEA